MKASKKKLFNPVACSTKLAAALSQDLRKDNYSVVSPEHRSWFSEYQHVNTLKKVEDAQHEAELHKKALHSFVARNHDLRSVNSLLSSNRAGIDDSTIVGYILRRARHLVRWVLADVTTEEIFDACRHSNGVTRGVSFADTSLNRKSLLPWTCTERVSRTVESYFAYDNLYAKACIEYTASFGPYRPGMITLVDGSRATTVPKQATKRRMICIEPTGNMYIQQGLMQVMYKRLAAIGLDVKTLPDRHQMLAFWASISGSDATIDLSNASDSVAYELVRYLFSPKWFGWLDLARCSTMEVLGESIQVESFATMGNATTFPVETLVFWAISVSVVDFTNHRQKDYGVRPWRIGSLLTLPSSREAVSVFGDDIILPRSAVPNLFYVLGQLGFSINTEKSFYDSGLSFRESCGGDFYHGRAVRPFFVRGPTTTSRMGFEAWFYVMANSLLKTYRSYVGGVGYFYESQAFELLFSWLLKVTPLVKVVPSSFPEDSGLRGPEGYRLARCYARGRISRVKFTEQGWVDFEYLRFRYKNRNAIFEALTYALRLKAEARGETFDPYWADYLPVEDPLEPLTPFRKKGDYVVARAVSPVIG
jgi:hypothetical protein